MLHLISSRRRAAERTPEQDVAAITDLLLTSAALNDLHTQDAGLALAIQHLDDPCAS